MVVPFGEHTHREVFDGHDVSCGLAVSSVTVTMNEQLAVFPLLSRAVQFTVVLPTGKLLPDGGVQVIVTFVPHRVVAVTGKSTFAPVVLHVQVRMSGGQTISTHRVSWLAVTRKMPVGLLLSSYSSIGCVITCR
jgi:hypothetical protein